MRCSIIVPTYNRAASLRAALAALARLEHEDYEIIVADDGSTDETGQVVRDEFPQVRYLRLEQNRGEWAARNRAIGEATGELFVFTDDDCIVAPDWLRRHTAHHAAPRVGAAGGPLEPSSRSFIDKFYVAHSGEVYRVADRIDKLNGWQELITGNLSVSRRVLEQVGLFDERFVLGADVDLVRRISRAGYAFVRDPALSVEHRKSYDFVSLLRNRFRKASGSIGTDVKEGTVCLRRFVPVPHPVALAQTWRRFRDLYGAPAAMAPLVGGMAVVVRWTEVAGRLYYYWTHARHQGWDPVARDEVIVPRTP